MCENDHETVVRKPGSRSGDIQPASAAICGTLSRSCDLSELPFPTFSGSQMS